MSTRTPPAVDGEPGGPTPTHTVFLSYSRADRKGALAIVRVLEAAGYGVWWDGLLEGGERFSRTTEAALAGARAVVVLWSKTSAGSHWVHDEATRGRESGRLVPLSLDGSLPPLGFRQFQTIDLSRVRGRADAPEFQRVLEAVAALHDGAPAAPVVGRRGVDRRVWLAGAGAMALGGAGLVAWRTGLVGGAAVQANTVVVLPFANMSGDGAQDYPGVGAHPVLRIPGEGRRYSHYGEIYSLPQAIL